MLVFRGVEHDGFFPAKGGTKPCFKKTAEFTHWLQSQASGDSREDVTTPLRSMNGWLVHLEITTN